MTDRLHILRLLAVWLVLLPVFTSCIYEDLEECPQPYSVCFRYDYNMEFANLFADEVDNLSVYVFNADGKYLRTFSDRGEALRKPGYRLPLPLEAGNYRFVTWAGLEGNDFVPTTLQPGVSSPDDLVVALRHDGGEVPSDSPLTPLWQAKAENIVVPEPGEVRTDTLGLVKDTKTIRVILQRRDGAPIHAADYGFRIECPRGNGRLAYDNTLLDEEMLIYRPYSQTETAATADTVAHVTADMSVSRLLVDNAMRLFVSKADGGSTLVDIPLIGYLLLTQMEQDKRIKSNQEYLDRQDFYTITLFLDGEPGEVHWFDGLIIINGWALRPGSTDL